MHNVLTLKFKNLLELGLKSPSVSNTTSLKVLPTIAIIPKNAI